MAVQWLRLDASAARGKVQSLVEELRSPKLCGVVKIKRKTDGRKEERERKAAGGNDLKCL